MRTIQVSEAVYARIWSLWQPGDRGEEQILSRVLAVEANTSPRTTPESSTNGREKSGFTDKRHKVFFPAGFEIRRKDGRTSAYAVDGGWRYDGIDYPSLNLLSTEGLGIKSENAWINWFYIDESGQFAPIDKLRDPATISKRRSKGARSLFDLQPVG